MSIESDYVDNNNTVIVVPDEAISNTVKFWIYLIILIPSIICSLFSLCYILFNRSLRNALHYHVISVVLFIGLIYQVTLYPWMLYYYHYKGVWHRSPLFCTIWSFIDWGLYFTQTILFAWATMERHILIFHYKWLLTKKRQFFIHYLPLLLLLSYCLAFYIVVSFFPSCENYFDDYHMICIGFCFTETYALYMWDAVVHQISPTLIIILFSFALLVRVVYQKHRMRRSFLWRKHRKMTVQLLSFSLLYLLFAFPLTLMNLMYLCGLPADRGVIFYEYLLFFNYLMIPLLPCACVLCLPELRCKMKTLLLRRQARTIAPTI